MPDLASKGRCPLGSGGRLLVWLLQALPLAGCLESTGGQPPNLVLIVLDTARREMCSVYGWKHPTTPFLERFAREGVRYDRAYSTSCWTLPAHASMFTGQLPDMHGADQLSGRLTADLPLLAELLAEAGYQTAGFSRNPWVSGRSRLDQGFQSFSELWSGADPELDARRGDPALEGARRWLESERDPARPYFLFVNLIEPHMPYAPGWDAARQFLLDEATWRSALQRYSLQGPRALFERHYARQEPLDATEWELVRGLYEGELRATDEIVRRLIEAVDSVATDRDTLVLIVSDHGENLGDHGHASHMFSLNEALTRVVFLARGPGFAPGGADDRLVQCTDVFPTLLAAAGLEPPPGPGRDLRAAAQPDRVLLTRVAWPRTWLATFPEATLASGVLAPYLRSLWAAQDERYKLVIGSDGEELAYDLLADPREQHPLGLERVDARRLERLRAAIRASREASSALPGEPGEGEPGPDAGLDEKTLQGLKALGYAK